MNLQLVDQNEKPHKPGTGWPQSTKSRALILARSNFSGGQISKILNVPRTTVRGWIQEADVPRRGPGGVPGQIRIPQQTIRKAAFLYENTDMSAQEIAESLGYRQGASVTRMLKLSGFAIRSKSESNRLACKRRNSKKAA